MCSGLNVCDPNVYCTEMSRTQVTDNFLESFEQSVLKLSRSCTQQLYQAHFEFSKFNSHKNSSQLNALLSQYAFPHSGP